MAATAAAHAAAIAAVSAIFSAIRVRCHQSALFATNELLIGATMPVALLDKDRVVPRRGAQRMPWQWND